MLLLYHTDDDSKPLYFTVILHIYYVGILHYLCSANLSESFSQLIVSIFIFSQYFFSIDFARWQKLLSIDYVKIYLFSVFFPKILPAGKKWRYLRSDIYAKPLFLHATTGCDTTFSINREGKATVFKKRL